MNKTSLLPVALFFILNLSVRSQVTHKTDSLLNSKKAKYLTEDLAQLLTKKTEFPNEALEKNEYGDVVLSFIVKSNGKPDSVTIVKSPHFSFSRSAVVAFNSLDELWSAPEINGSPAEKKYSIVFRYRIYYNVPPSEYKSSAVVALKKQKYEKALKLFDKAIKENQFDYELFRERSRIKEILGDSEGAEQDKFTASNLENEIMAIVNINAKGTARQVRTMTGSKIVAVPVSSPAAIRKY